jgi:hypothetical protein
VVDVFLDKPVTPRKSLCGGVSDITSILGGGTVNELGSGFGKQGPRFTYAVRKIKIFQTR